MTPRRLGRKQSKHNSNSNVNDLGFVYFKSWTMLSYSLNLREKNQRFNHEFSNLLSRSRLNIINPASGSTIKQHPLLNWNYYRFNLVTSHSRNHYQGFFRAIDKFRLGTGISCFGRLEQVCCKSV